jgi:hypothetical protein
MSKDEDLELNELLATSPDYGNHPKIGYSQECDGEDPACQQRTQMKNLVQWTTGDDKIFVPASRTVKTLFPACYEIAHSPTIGIYFQKIPVKTEGLIRFPQTNCDKVVEEIQKFWANEDRFREYHLTYKRGIILWGPPGSGKSCTIQLIMKDVVEREGIVIKFASPGLFIEGMRIFREIQPATPAVILMEDIDSTLEHYPETEVLNILDGVDQVEKAVFLATTNYPERLGARILNRPSRFDKRFKIGHPNEESRMLYFRYLVGGGLHGDVMKDKEVDRKVKELGIDLDRWVEDSDGMSIAHLKELFIAVVILKDEYEEAITTLGSMREVISSEEDRDRMVGFSMGQKKPKRME